jgi:hypothetical protein
MTAMGGEDLQQGVKRSPALLPGGARVTTAKSRLAVQGEAGLEARLHHFRVEGVQTIAEEARIPREPRQGHSPRHFGVNPARPTGEENPRRGLFKQQKQKERGLLSSECRVVSVHEPKPAAQTCSTSISYSVYPLLDREVPLTRAARRGLPEARLMGSHFSVGLS